MRIFSDDRDTIFTPFEKPSYYAGDFPDFYKILDIEKDADSKAIENAIYSRGADLLTASFSRGGKSEIVDLLQQYQNVFRLVLLDSTARASYNALLLQHQRGEESISIDEFLKPFREKKLVRWWRRVTAERDLY
jgi:hypothetical protein